MVLRRCLGTNFKSIYEMCVCLLCVYPFSDVMLEQSRHLCRYFIIAQRSPKYDYKILELKLFHLDLHIYYTSLVIHSFILSLLLINFLHLQYSLDLILSSVYLLNFKNKSECLLDSRPLRCGTQALAAN